jgi:hypothetical protein
MTLLKNKDIELCLFYSAGQKLIASLISMTFRDRIKTIRSQPKTMEEKRKLRYEPDLSPRPDYLSTPIFYFCPISKKVRNK